MAFMPVTFFVFESKSIRTLADNDPMRYDITILIRQLLLRLINGVLQYILDCIPILVAGETIKLAIIVRGNRKSENLGCLGAGDDAEGLAAGPSPFDHTCTINFGRRRV